MSGARVIPLEAATIGELDDTALVEALRRGVPGAERLAWCRLGPMVACTLCRLAGPGCDEEDLSQQVFLRFFRTVRRLRDPAAIRAFLTGICIRVVRREVRRRWLRRWLRLTPAGDVPEVAGPDADPESRQVVDHYYRVLDRLSADARSLFANQAPVGASRVAGPAAGNAERSGLNVAVVSSDAVSCQPCSHDGPEVGC